MLKLTRIVTVLYTAAAGIAAVYVDPVQVAAAVGVITALASGIANVLKDGTVLDAVFNGLAINVTKKTTVSP